MVLGCLVNEVLMHTMTFTQVEVRNVRSIKQSIAKRNPFKTLLIF